jgi:hypothetical protein
MQVLQLSETTILRTRDPSHHIFGPSNRIIEPQSEVKKSPRCTTLHYVALRCTTLQYVALRC